MLQKINLWDEHAVVTLNQWITNHSPAALNTFLAIYLIYALPLILIVLWFYSLQTKKVALRALFSTILAWPILAKIIAHIVHRARPLGAPGVKELIFHRPDFSFPSDHAAALFAVAFSLWLSGYKKLSLAVFGMAIVISFFRVALAIHFPSDILAGAAVGIAAAFLIHLFDKPLEFVYNLIIRTFKLIHLA